LGSKLERSFVNIKSAAMAATLKTEVIEIPEWVSDGNPVRVLVKEFTSGQRNRYVGIAQRAVRNGKPVPESYTAEMVIDCAYDPDTGEHAFAKSDRDALVGLPSGPLETISDTIIDLSGMKPEAARDAEKNSERAGESTSSLPVN